MPIIITKYLFILIASLLSILLSIRTFHTDMFMKNNKLSPLMALLGGLFLLYVFAGVLLAIFLPTIKNSLVIIFFALSPFIIGKLVSYKTLKTYSIIQILCVIFSLVFVMLI